jgi:GNAT superfamily N-acetyltransferase
VTVRSATVQDVATLAPLWREFVEREATSGGVPAGFDIGGRVRDRIVESEAVVESGGRPTYRLAVAVVDSEVVGFASYSVVDRGLLATSPVVVVDLVHVAGSQRKKGVGTTLMRSAVSFADEVGATDVVVNVPPTARDVNRFYARIGFSPMVIRRSAPVGQLRRRLGVEPRLDPRDVTADLTPVERSLRRRILLAPRRSVTR